MTAVPADLSRPRRVHLVGVGGAGMSGIARVLMEERHEVSGSDMRDARVLDELRAMGATITIGHDAAAVRDAEVVVASSAVPPTNPELAFARDKGLQVLSRAQMLASLAAGRTGIMIAGTHGKTTVTSMTVVALQAAGLDPGFVIGGHLNEVGTNAHAGTDPPFVAEADESDRSLLAYEPAIAVVTNVELDHPDAFRDDAEVAMVFAEFLERRAEDGLAVICLDDPGSAELRGRARQPVVTYGTHPDAGVRLLAGSEGHVVSVHGSDPVDLVLSVPGHHNLLNATAAVAVVAALGADVGRAAAGLRAFRGAARRFQVVGVANGVTVVDDYAHHPTEVLATIRAARERHDGRVVAVIQPHRYSRTAVLGEALGRAAGEADIAIVTDVYGSGEAPQPGITGKLVADGAEAAGVATHWTPHLSDVPGIVVDVVQAGDVVLLMGAGDITSVGPAVVERLRAHG
ncbi:MAG: UDP-N-acetylmuramate--L-alanine ligase [Nitriliruptorales bacterium]|nr:UDP-N-acetylmuramate--L-alanine ligase [Nitriliruptorales bacterium]